MRLRVDRYFSNVPYNRMVAAIGQLTAVESKEEADGVSSKNRGANGDESIRQTFYRHLLMVTRQVLCMAM